MLSRASARISRASRAKRFATHSSVVVTPSRRRGTTTGFASKMATRPAPAACQCLTSRSRQRSRTTEMTFGSFDPYTLRARVYPALAAIAPLIVAIAGIVPWDRLSWIHGLAAAAVPILLWIAADIARQLGRKLEIRLFERWGKPTTV